jgi:hypothetical protein
MDFKIFKKKKEDEFNFDNENLPSLSDLKEKTPELSSKNNLPSEDNLDYSEKDSSGIKKPEVGLEPVEKMSDEDLISDASSKVETMPKNDFGIKSFEPKSISSDLSSNEKQDLSSELMKTKIESLDSKVNLLSAKVSRIDSKLDMIYNILSLEVSDETKRRLHLDSMKKEFHS